MFLKMECLTAQLYLCGIQKGKNTAIDNFIEKYDIDLSKSYAYGDT